MDRIERIRQAYYVKGKSMRQIERELHHSWRTIKKALASPEEGQYTLKEPREAPVLGPYKERIKELLAENERLPGKHRLTGHRIFQLLQKEGYPGSESGVLVYLWQLRKANRKVKVYLPLEFEPGEDGQVDWGEAQVILNGKQGTVQREYLAELAKALLATGEVAAAQQCGEEALKFSLPYSSYSPIASVEEELE